jgi:drug/metabolite transporter (DMT)-like permease
MTLAILFMSGNVLVGRAVHEDVPPAGLTFWRALVAVGLLLPFVLVPLRAQFRTLLAHWRLLLALGLVWGICGHLVVLTGLHTTTAINAGLMAATQPALTMVMARLLLGDPIAGRQVLGIGIALLGVVVIMARGDSANLLGLDFVPGDLLVQLGMVSFALYTVLIKRAPTSVNPFVVFWGVAFFTMLTLLPVYAAEIVFGGRRIGFDAVTVSAVLYLAVFASILAVVFLNIAVSRIGPTRAGAFFYLTPVFTLLLASALLDETVEAYHLAGMVLVIAGVYLLSWTGRRNS